MWVCHDLPLHWTSFKDYLRPLKEMDLRVGVFTLDAKSFECL